MSYTEKRYEQEESHLSKSSFSLEDTQTVTPINRNKKVDLEIISIEFFDRYVWPLLEKDGWTVNEGSIYLSPKNVKKLQLMSFDSKENLIRYLKSDSFNGNNCARDYLLALDIFYTKHDEEVEFNDLYNHVEEIVLLKQLEKSINDAKEKLRKNSIASEKKLPIPQNDLFYYYSKGDKSYFRKGFPRYIGRQFSTSDLVLMFPPSKVNVMFEEATLKKKDELSNPDRKNLLSVSVDDTNEECIHSVLIKVEGRSDLVKKAITLLIEYVKGIVILHNLYELTRRNDSIIVEVFVNASTSIGAYIFDATEMDNMFDEKSWAYGLPPDFCKALDEMKAGVWIDKFTENSSLLKVVGNELLGTGACILKIADTPVKNKRDVIKEWTKGKEEGKEFLKFTLCVGHNTTLTSIDPDQVYFQTEDRLLYMRDGEICTKWQFKPNEGFFLKPMVIDVSSSQQAIASDSQNKKADSSKKQDNNASANGSNHNTPYRQFSAKYLQVRTIEYVSRGFNSSRVSKAMWTQHKKRYGLTCPKSCICPSHLPILCENVISEASSSASIDQNEVGFVRFFHAKFYSKLQNEFPEDSHAELLEKLVILWGEHRKMRLFGIQCKPICPCDQNWNLFREVLNKEIKKVTNMPSQNKQRTSNLVSPSSITIAGKDKTKPMSKKPEKTFVSDKMIAFASKNGRNGEEFIIPFDPHRPLGIYFITESKSTTGTQKESKCKVYSINPKCSIDPRIKRGTIITASSFSIGTTPGLRVELSSHAALQSRYNTARTKGSSAKLFLYFVNNLAIPMEASANFSQDWTDSGQWKGHTPSSPGWAGGALGVNVSTRTQGKLNKKRSLEDVTQPKSTKALKSSSKISDTLKSLIGKKKESPVESNKKKKTSELINKSKESNASSIDDTLKQAKSFLATSTSSTSPVKNVDGHFIKRNKEKQKEDFEFGNDNDDLSASISLEQSNSLDKEPEDLHKETKNGDKQNASNRRKRVCWATQLNFEIRYDPSTAANGEAPVGSDSPSSTKPIEKVDENDAEKKDGKIDSEPTQEIFEQREDILTVDSLTTAVKKKDLKDVSLILKSGSVNAEEHDLNGKSALDYVSEISKQLQQRLDDANRQGKRIPPAEREMVVLQLHEMSLKKKLLKIYILADSIIKNAKYLEDWISVAVTISNVDDLMLSARGLDPSNYSPYAFCSTSYNGQHPVVSEELQMSQKIVWDRLASNPCAVLRYNDFAYREVSVIIKLMMGRVENNDINKLLGTAKLSYEVLKEFVEKGSKKSIRDSVFERKMYLDLVGTKLLEKNASLEIIIEKLPFDTDFIIRRCEETKKKMLELITWIQAFQNETKTSDFLDFNISAFNLNGFSLLHAAVFMEDVALVDYLIKLGADPMKSCEEGTPYDLASWLFENYNNEGFFNIKRILQPYAVKENKNEVVEEQMDTLNVEDDLDDDLDDDLYSDLDTTLKPAQDVTQKSSYSKETHLPVIPVQDWMCSVLRRSRCPHFSKGECPYRSQCKNLHFHKLLGERENTNFKYDESAKKLLKHENIYTNSARSADDKSWYTAAYVHPHDKLIFYAEGGDGILNSSQQIFWYHDAASAIDAVSRIVAHYQEEKDNDKLMVTRDSCKDVDEANTSYSDEQKLESTSKQVKLPILSQPNWMEISGTNAHVQKPLGALLDRNDIITNDLSRLLKDFSVFDLEEKAEDGTTWFTSAYCEWSEYIIYYAERGVDGHKSEQNIWWYPSLELSLIALRRVVYVSRVELRKAKQMSHHSSSHYGPLEQSRTELIYSGYESASEMKTFRDLYDYNNFSNIHVKMYGKNLTKTCWNVKEREKGSGEGLIYTAELNPRVGDIPSVYPIGYGGEFIDRSYWYNEERVAKTATYLTYLVELVKKRKLKDVRHKNDGSKLF